MHGSYTRWPDCCCYLSLDVELVPVPDYRIPKCCSGGWLQDADTGTRRV
jgi:hypothetical protein